MRISETGRTTSNMRHAQRAYFDPARPNVTKEVSAAIERMATDGVRLSTDENGVPKLSTNALAFLWHSTESDEEAQWSDADDWRHALDGMWEDEWALSNHLGYAPKIDHLGRQCLRYNPDWPAVIELLRYSSVRELVKCDAVLNWFGSGAREVPFDLKADYARIFLPTYHGPSLTLYRGCAVGNERQHYWTTRKSLARKFAYTEGGKMRALVSVRAPSSAIICDLRPFFRDYSEIVVDPSLLSELKILERAAGSSFCDRAHRFYADELQRNSFRDRMTELRSVEIPITAPSLELDRLGRALRQLYHSTNTTVFSRALKVLKADANAKAEWDWHRCQELTREEREERRRTQEAMQEERELLQRMQEMAERGMTLEGIADEIDYDPGQLADFLPDIAESKTHAALAFEITAWIGE